MDKEVKRITKETLDYYKEHIDECDITILRGLYMDLKNGSVPKDKIEKLLKKHQQIRNKTDKRDITGISMCNVVIGALSELLDVPTGVCADMTFCANESCVRTECRRHMTRALLIPSWHPISFADFNKNGKGPCEDYIN